MMEAAHTETTATGDSHISSSLNPNASAFTPSGTPQPVSPQQSPASQAFKPPVKYCYYEQFGQCNKGDACPFTHRSQEQCWYEANGGCKRGAACLFKHTGIAPSNDAASPTIGETTEDHSKNNGEAAGDTTAAVKQASGIKVPSMASPTINSAMPGSKKPAGPTLNTAMLEAKLSSAKKSTTGDSVPNKLATAGNGLRSIVKPQETMPPISIPTNQAKTTTNASAQVQGIALKGTAKLALANAVKSNPNGTTTGKPMSALRAAALASVKGNPNGSAKGAEAKPVTRRVGPAVAATITSTTTATKPTMAAGKQAAVQSSASPNNKQVAAQASPIANQKQASKPGLPTKPALPAKPGLPAKPVVPSKPVTAPGSANLNNKQTATQVLPNANNKQAAAAQGSPNPNNKQAAKKPNAKASPAGTDDGLKNIKILTFEEIMAQKRAKKEAEQATAATGSPKTGSPRPIPARPAPVVKAPTPPVATVNSSPVTVEKTATTPPVTQVNPSNKANQKPESVAPPSVSKAPPGHSSKQVAAATVPSPATATAVKSAVAPQATTLKSPVNNIHSNGNSQIGSKRPAEPNPPAVQPPLKKPAGEQLSKNKAMAQQSMPVVKPTPAPPAPKINKPTASTPPVQIPVLPPTSQKRPLDIDEETKSNKKQAVETTIPTPVDEEDELAQFEAEFGELDGLEGGDMKDFDEESIMKELEELEGDV